MKQGFAAVAAIVAIACWQPDGVTKELARMQIAHLRVDSTLGDLLHHPAFAGFAQRILPWDDKAYDERLLLRDIGSLLPYHTHVDPDLTVSALNRMIDDVAVGRTVFYEFYTDAEMRSDPTKKHIGLFLFRGKPGAPFCVIAPGGGFSYVGSVHEGFPHAVSQPRWRRSPDAALLLGATDR